MALVKCAYCGARFADVAASRTHVAADHDREVGGDATEVTA